MKRPNNSLPSSERVKIKRYLAATLVTCLGAAMIGGSLHVVDLGAGRIESMRKMVSYDIKEMDNHIRAAGEDITLHEQHEGGFAPNLGYTTIEAERLISREDWETLSSMVIIPAGPFIMGTDKAVADDQDKPAHVVKLPAFAIDKYITTNAQYARFVAATRHRPPLDWKNGRMTPHTEMLPVTMVTWYDAKAYCAWDHKRLPTEAEFEKAGRGTDERRWPWGNLMDYKKMNTYYNVGSATNVLKYSDGVSPYGVYDMAGNVSEWIADDFTPYPNSKAPQVLFKGKINVPGGSGNQEYKISDQKEIDKSYKVLRGGSWKSDPFSTAIYHRNFNFAKYATDFYGFRCVSDAPAGGKL
jgi:formylglycine-generating enzyme required for sulfatase activity